MPAVVPATPWSDYEEMAMRRMFGFVIGIAIGALVGSTVALLLAPGPGERLREQLRARGGGRSRRR